LNLDTAIERAARPSGVRADGDPLHSDRSLDRHPQRSTAESRLGERLACRAGCGACCIAPSISSPIPGMPQGKAAGVRCVQLTGDNRCAIFGQPDRPQVCVSLRPSAAMCGADRTHALAYLHALEHLTQP
jgi:hypothetical protein